MTSASSVARGPAGPCLRRRDRASYCSSAAALPPCASNLPGACREYNPRSMSLAGHKILITGGLGFIGSNLALRLAREGARISICDAMIEGYGGNFENVREIREA